MDARGDQPDVVARRHLGVARHVPRGRPAQGARQRLGEARDAAVDQGAQGALVEPDLGVGEVVVVDQDQVGLDLADQLLDRGAGADDVELDALHADQGAVGPGVEPDGDAVGPQGRVVGRGLLQDLEVQEPALGIHGEGRAQRVDPGGLQPLLRPGRQVAARGALQGRQKVLQLGVAPGVLAEVVADAGQEVVEPDVGHELLEHRGALGVGDAVEVDLDGLHVGDVGGDRVRGGKLVLPVGPGLLDVGEGGPRRLAPAGGLGLAQHRHVGRERLVQPQVVPPAHGDQVAEPHVGHLVQDRLGAALHDGVGDARAEDVVLQEGDRPGVLHRARVELRHEQLVVLAEGVADAEDPVEEVEALLGDLDDVAGVEVLGQRGPAEDAEGDAVVLVAHHGVRPGDQGRDVGRHDRRGREVPALGGLERAVAAAVLLQLLHGVGGGVGDDLPVGGHERRELEGRLEVGLVEAGVHAVGVGRLELRVEVDLLVHGVDEPVEALAGAHVGAVGVDLELVARPEAGKGQSALLRVVGGHVDLRAVQDGLADLGLGQVDERARPGLGAGESDRSDALEPLVAFGQIELDRVGVHLQQSGPLPGFVTGQVACHIRSSSRLSPAPSREGCMNPATSGALMAHRNIGIEGPRGG